MYQRLVTYQRLAVLRQTTIIQAQTKVKHLICHIGVVHRFVLLLCKTDLLLTTVVVQVLVNVENS
jgi:hypothetical protein